MDGPRQLIIEFERVQRVRKEARTHLRYCEKCARNSEFISVAQAAELFELSEEELLVLHRDGEKRLHFQDGSPGRPDMCVEGILAAMRKRWGGHVLKIATREL